MIVLWILLFLILFSFVSYLALIAPSFRKPDDSHLRGWMYAHRGLHDGNVNVPENSMKAFELAVEKGYGMELDVQLTHDRKLVVHHDGTLKRVCGVDKRIWDTDYADLPLLPDGSRIPLLTEVLSMVDGRVPIIVEIKHYGSAGGVGEAAYEVLKDYTGPYCVEAFNPISLLVFRKKAPHIVRGQLATGGKWDRKETNLATHLTLKYLLTNMASRPHFVAYSVPNDRVFPMWMMKHIFKPYLACWTVRDQKTLDYARKEGYQHVIFELFTPDK